MGNQKYNILVLAGGESGERAVSLDSARAIVDALRGAGHRVQVIDTLNGRQISGPDGAFIDDKIESRELPAPYDPATTTSLAKISAGSIDVVFNALHGGAGENGTIQAVLDMLGLPYSGSPMAASAVAMNKDLAKRIMWSLNIPTAHWKCYDADEASAAAMHNDIADGSWQYPVIIKPNDGGSTVGLSLVEIEEQLPDAVALACRFGDSVMMEAYMKGREITIAVLDGMALAPVEIVPSHKLYDYDCKYTKGKSQYICPAELDAKIVEKLSADAVRLYKTMGCRGYARVDFIVAPDGTYICLELNTLPGMTALSLFPMAAKHAGYSFGGLLEKLCELAIAGK